MKRSVYFENRSSVGRSGDSVEKEEAKRVSRNMDGPLSAYWVKFFKNAGFSSEVATRHAVIFSNNRIQPDMLPDLDKPSLKEMGITLMGDMIAILRYAKKVVEETSCEKILVNSETPSDPPKNNVSKPVVKKVVTKFVAKPYPTKPPSSQKVKGETPPKIIKTASSSTVKPTVTIKKKLPPISQTSRMYSDYIENVQKPKTIPLKRKYDDDDNEEEEEEGIDGKWVHNETSKRLKSTPDDVKYKVIMPKGTTVRSQKILKKALEHKKTVFHRLGDSMVSSTTSIAESSNSNYSNPTFSVTGIGQDVYKRNSSVFNRLGNKDTVDEVSINRNVRNGNDSFGTHGILKTRTPLLGTKIIATKVITTKPTLKKSVGTMRADEEANKKAVSERVKPLVTTMRQLKFTEKPIRRSPVTRKVPISGKLASETSAVPAKSRLGASKQVTFNKMATVNHVRKQGVFSRLGV